MHPSGNGSAALTSMEMVAAIEQSNACCTRKSHHVKTIRPDLSYAELV